MWHQANNAYWAYVLVQYDDVNSSYTYGYTFKDSAGYGIYPTSQLKLNEQGKQIQTGLDLSQPRTGKVTTITSVDNWDGFDVDSTTNLVVLVASSEESVGDGKTTCTLQQKGDNYADVEEDKVVEGSYLYFGRPYEAIVNGVNQTYIFKEDGSVEYYYDCELQYLGSAGDYSYHDGFILFDDLFFDIAFEISEDKKSVIDYWDYNLVYTLNRGSNWCEDKNKELPMLRNANDSVAFWQYKKQIKTITFQDSINIPSDIPSDHKWDVTKSQTGKVMAYITPNSTNSSYYDLYIQADGKIYAPTNSSRLFADFSYLDYINNIELLDTTKVVNMSGMFDSAGYYSTVFKLDLGDNFDTSNVVDMSRMFGQTGNNSPVFTLDLGNKFDTSNVVDMSQMFWVTGAQSQVLTLDLGDKFDTSNVTDMVQMFYRLGYTSKVFTLDLGDKFDTSNVTDMSYMFKRTGWKNPQFTLDLGDKFDTGNVKEMDYMFYLTGNSSSVFKVDCSNWNVDKVTKYNDFRYNDSPKVIPPKWKN